MGRGTPVIDMYHVITEKLITESISLVKLLPALGALAHRQQIKHHIVLHIDCYRAIVTALPRSASIIARFI